MVERKLTKKEWTNIHQCRTEEHLRIVEINYPDKENPEFKIVYGNAIVSEKNFTSIEAAEDWLNRNRSFVGCLMALIILNQVEEKQTKK